MDETTSDAAQTSWPGEREPTRDDVQQANEVPDSAFLLNFRNALLASEDARLVRRMGHAGGTLHGNQRTWNSDRQAPASEQATSFTYPMSALIDFNGQLPAGDIEKGRANFFRTFRQHAYVDSLPLPSAADAVMPPSLRYAFACLGSALVLRLEAEKSAGTMNEAMFQVSKPQELASQLFHAGSRLDVLMIESDNRHARSISTIISLVLRGTYGILTADDQLWSISAADYCYAITMVRRLRLGDSAGENRSTQHHLSDAKAKSSLMSYLLLVDTVRALHCAVTPQLSSTELDIAMPSSMSIRFDAIYAMLFQPSTGLPHGFTGSDGPLLLLLAILSDHLHVQASFGSFTSGASSIASPLTDYADHTERANPFVPFFPATELSKIQDRLSLALSSWYGAFHNFCAQDTLALYYYSRLSLVFAEINRLPRMAGYPPSVATTVCNTVESEDATKVSDEALRLAWLVIEHVDMKKAALQSRISIWLPVIVFHAALVVWQKLQSSATRTYGSLRVLSVFEKELAQMPWPCCKQMVDTLQKLIT